MKSVNKHQKTHTRSSKAATTNVASVHENK